MLKNIFVMNLLLATVAAGAAEPAKLPLVKGMVEVAASQSKEGDVEQVMTVTDATPAYVEFSVEFRFSEKGKQVSEKRIRRVRRADLAASNRQNIVFQPGDSDMFPGSTLIHVSAATLSQLKSQKKVPMIIGAIKRDDSMNDLPAIMDVTSGRKYFRGNLERVGKATESITVKVNGKAALLPVLHAKGQFTVAGDSIDVELWILDDAANPMVLRMSGKGGKRQTIRIDYPAAQPQVSVLQQSLASGACRAELNGIYFDFGKATLLPQSASALNAVADLMKKNPGWNLRIEGHTDSVGAAAYNLDLSKRRAVAVGNALTSQYKLSAARLNANGFGATKPVAKNDTLEGRAANRRVELARTCP